METKLPHCIISLTENGTVTPVSTILHVMPSHVLGRQQPLHLVALWTEEEPMHAWDPMLVGVNTGAESRGQANYMHTNPSSPETAWGRVAELQ